MTLQEMPMVGYTLPAAARILGIHPKYIFQLVNKGKINFFYGLDDRKMIAKEELYLYMRGREQGE